MTHEYTLLLGATVLPGGGRAACEAIAWAHGIVLALGSDAEVRAISRGDSRVLEYPGAFVVPLGAPLEVGGPADLAVLARDPRAGGDRAEGAPIAVLRSGRPSLTSAPGRGPGAPRGHGRTGRLPGR